MKALRYRVDAVRMTAGIYIAVSLERQQRYTHGQYLGFVWDTLPMFLVALVGASITGRMWPGFVRYLEWAEYH